ncbi:Uncharacterised protein [Chlamydia abortus]|nr:Uncharacterised protein [Chlamydia abortus]
MAPSRAALPCLQAPSVAVLRLRGSRAHAACRAATGHSRAQWRALAPLVRAASGTDPAAQQHLFGEKIPAERGARNHAYETVGFYWVAHHRLGAAPPQSR